LNDCYSSKRNVRNVMFEEHTTSLATKFQLNYLHMLVGIFLMGEELYVWVCVGSYLCILQGTKQEPILRLLNLPLQRITAF
jgi:hypothetical protein